MWDIDKIKQDLKIESIELLLADLGGEPIRKGDVIMSKTICHGGESHKLYYYDNTKLFHCYTGCENPSFDIFELVSKATKQDLYQSVEMVVQFFNIADKNKNFFIHTESNPSEEVLARWEATKNEKINKDPKVLKIYDADFLKNYPRPRVSDWEQEGISKEVMDGRGICYDPVSHGIIIPHFDAVGNIVGIRERTLVKEKEIYGKYRPAYINRKMYNHPLGFNLYNLNYAAPAIAKYRKAIIFEGEKSCLLYATYFGMENDISVACCGSSISNTQIDLLAAAGAEEIIIALDKQYQANNDEECMKWLKKYCHFDHNRGSLYFTYMFDDGDYLGYKCSPIDCGKETFIKMFAERKELNYVYVIRQGNR